MIKYRMTCSLSLIFHTNPPALPWTWSGSRRNHCGMALRTRVDCAAWADIAFAAVDVFFLDLLPDFFEGIVLCCCCCIVDRELRNERRLCLLFEYSSIFISIFFT